MKQCILINILLLFVCSTSFNQTYEIRAVNANNGFIAVEMQITSGTPPATSDFLTDLVFGLKWEVSYNVDLKSSISTDYDIRKSGGRETNGAFHYQAFYANATPFNIPNNWQSNTWVEIMRVQNTLNGSQATGTFEICELGSVVD